MESPVIQLKDVYKQFGSKVVLQGASLSIPKGKTTVIIGKSGAGKSVLLKCIAGLLEVDSGHIFFEGEDIAQLSKSELAGKRQKMSYMFQNNALFDSLNAFDNIALPLREKTKLSSAEIEHKVTAILAKIDLADIGEKYPSELSGGMQKRVALARALVTEPNIVLFDEPTAGLDPIRKNTVFAMIEHSQKVFGFTAVVVTHELPDALYVADEVAVLDESVIAFQGAPLIFEQRGSGLARTFLESDEALKNMMLGLRSKVDFENCFPELSEQGKGWLLVSLSSFTYIREFMGKIACQAILQAMVESIRAHSALGGEAFMIDSHTMLIALNQDGVDEDVAARSISKALEASKYFQESTYVNQQVDITITFSVDKSSVFGLASELILKLREEMKVAYQLKRFESKETV